MLTPSTSGDELYRPLALKRSQSLPGASVASLHEKEPVKDSHTVDSICSDSVPEYPSHPETLLDQDPPCDRLDEASYKPTIGNAVLKGHANYGLMFDMLTGIRISVSRCMAKPDRSLLDSDFTASHKLAFDSDGKELIPTSKYSFKFKDYAPWAFRHVREAFKIDTNDYLSSIQTCLAYRSLLGLTGKYVLSELCSPGKSGSFFYFSRDYRFIIKVFRHLYIFSSFAL